MAKRTNITASFFWFAGEDKVIRIPIVDEDDSALNVSSFALTFELKLMLDTVIGSALISKTTGAGDITFDSDAGTNDRVLIAIDDDDTEGLTGTYSGVLRRTDAGSEGVLWIGSCVIQSIGLTSA